MLLLSVPLIFEDGQSIGEFTIRGGEAVDDLLELLDFEAQHGVFPGLLVQEILEVVVHDIMWVGVVVIAVVVEILIQWLVI